MCQGTCLYSLAAAAVAGQGRPLYLTVQDEWVGPYWFLNSHKHVGAFARLCRAINFAFVRAQSSIIFYFRCLIHQFFMFSTLSSFSHIWDHIKTYLFIAILQEGYDGASTKNSL